MSNKFKEIVINPKTVYTLGGSVEIMAGASLSPDDVNFLVETTLQAEQFLPVFLVTNGGYRQRLPYDQLEVILAVPLAERRAQIAAQQATDQAKREKAFLEMEAQRKQEQEQTKRSEAKPAIQEAIG